MKEQPRISKSRSNQNPVLLRMPRRLEKVFIGHRQHGMESFQNCWAVTGNMANITSEEVDTYFLVKTILESVLQLYHVQRSADRLQLVPTNILENRLTIRPAVVPRSECGALPVHLALPEFLVLKYVRNYLLCHDGRSWHHKISFEILSLCIKAKTGWIPSSFLRKIPNASH